jgi:hypothetical protein
MAASQGNVHMILIHSFYKSAKATRTTSDFDKFGIPSVCKLKKSVNHWHYLMSGVPPIDGVGGGGM